MTDTKLPASHGTPFAPRALVPVAVGRTLVNLYAVIDPGMHVEERAHAFQINKTALASTPVDLRVQLDALGQQLNLAATVDGVHDDWLRFFHDSWCDFSRLAILSFHNDAGDQINDTTTAAKTAVLLPVIDRILANCRQPNVKFVRVQITLDFRPLVSVDPPGLTTLRVEYYVELPQTSRVMTNGVGVGYNLVTYHGPDDLCTLTMRQVQNDILTQTLQDGPYDLQPASFNLTQQPELTARHCDPRSRGRFCGSPIQRYAIRCSWSCAQATVTSPMPCWTTSARCIMIVAETTLSAQSKRTSNS